MKGKYFRWVVAGVLVIAVVAAVFLSQHGREDTTRFHEKADLLRQSVVADWVELETGINPAGHAGHAVFLSVCDGKERASVYTGTGENLAAAWDAAVAKTDKALKKSGLEPQWLKADVVYVSEAITMDELMRRLTASQYEFFRYGAAFDENFQTAFLEAEMNGVQIYDYDEGTVDLEAMNDYLKQTGRKTVSALPGECTLFQCIGWLCDEESQIYELKASGLDYGRRQVETLDAETAKELILNASDFLENQVQEDGSFLYGIYPCFDENIDDYNMVRHASTIWSLICRYRLAPDEELEEKITQTISYMLDSVVYDSEGRAYLLEKTDEEIKLGGNGVAVIALTEYMDAFQNDQYTEVCTALGNGILSMMDQKNGTYYHVLNSDFTRKEEFRTIYYDGEATFALCRLYGLTKEQVWLDAAQSAVEHFIEADYTQYKDHWVAYTMNEITKYVPDRPEYYVFALENAQKNLQSIAECETTYHTYLELLVSAFEVYDRMIQNGGSADGFDLWSFLSTVYTRAERQLNGYFYPEYAMYMENPQRIMDTFMVRQDRYRVRIDDVQHNIGGYYLYYTNYDKLVQYGMLICAAAFN